MNPTDVLPGATVTVPAEMTTESGSRNPIAVRIAFAPVKLEASASVVSVRIIWRRVGSVRTVGSSIKVKSAVAVCPVDAP
jgi:hypothetical protein